MGNDEDLTVRGGHCESRQPNFGILTLITGALEVQPTFIAWQRLWRPTPGKPRRVLAIDYRGHGQSFLWTLVDVSAVIISPDMPPKRVAKQG